MLRLAMPLPTHLVLSRGSFALTRRQLQLGLCFGTYGEGSEGVHILVDRIAHKLTKERGEELGCDKEKVLGLFKQRTRCALGVAAVRARAVARAARRPLVGCTTV